MTEGIAELWIRLADGRSICERYNQREMAEFVRESMVERVSLGQPVICYDGEAVEVPARDVRRIDFVLVHRAEVPAAMV
jgi:hypothetical protein